MEGDGVMKLTDMIFADTVFGRGKGSDGEPFTFNANCLCQYPEEMIVPETVTKITSSIRAFKEHTEIKKITFKARTAVISIESAAFKGCSSLEHITLPDTLSYLPYAMFDSCSALEEIVIPQSVTSVAHCVFQYCTSLKKITFIGIPTGSYYTNTGGYSPFYRCTALEEVVFPQGWTESIAFSNGTTSFTNVLTHDSMVAMIANLYDYSGGTAHTLTLGATNLARLSEEEIAVATAKNWTVT